MAKGFGCHLSSPPKHSISLTVTSYFILHVLFLCLLSRSVDWPADLHGTETSGLQSAVITQLPQSYPLFVSISSARTPSCSSDHWLQIALNKMFLNWKHVLWKIASQSITPFISHSPWFKGTTFLSNKDLYHMHVILPAFTPIRIIVFANLK